MADIYSPRQKVYECPHCGRYYTGHYIWEHREKAHGDYPPSAKEQPAVQSTPTPQQEDAMPKAYCDDCHQKDLRILEIQQAHKDALKEKDNAIKVLEAQVQSLQQELEAIAHRPIAEIVQHYEDCPNCGPEWQKVKASIVRKAWEDIPEQVLVEQAEKRGLLPKRIVLRG